MWIMGILLANVMSDKKRDNHANKYWALGICAGLIIIYVCLLYTCGCVCNLLCKILSAIMTLLVVVAVILLILWGVGVVFTTEEVSNQAHRLMGTDHRPL